MNYQSEESLGYFNACAIITSYHKAVCVTGLITGTAGWCHPNAGLRTIKHFDTGLGSLAKLLVSMMSELPAGIVFEYRRNVQKLSSPVPKPLVTKPPSPYPIYPNLSQ